MAGVERRAGSPSRHVQHAQEAGQVGGWAGRRGCASTPPHSCQGGEEQLLHHWAFWGRASLGSGQCGQRASWRLGQGAPCLEPSAPSGAARRGKI